MNVEVDSALLEQAILVSGGDSATATVTRALEEFIATRRQAGILDLFGTLDWDPDYDYKAERGRG